MSTPRSTQPRLPTCLRGFLASSLVYYLIEYHRSKLAAFRPLASSWLWRRGEAKSDFTAARLTVTTVTTTTTTSKHLHTTVASAVQ